MRFSLLSAALLSTLFTVTQAADLHAVTEDGQKVLLSSNGKWRIDDSQTAAAPSLSTSPYHTAVKNYSVVFDTTQWVPAEKTGDGTDVNKKVFHHKSLPIYGIVIADELGTTTDALKNIIIKNAEKAADKPATVVLDGTEKMNGKDIGAIRFIINKDGINFMFATNYYASSAGNIQVVCYTSQDLFAKYVEDCKKFIGGLRIE